MNALLLELPMDALLLPGASSQSLAAEARFMLALKLFEVGRLSSGKAGQLCVMGRVEFLLAAGRSGVAVVNLDAEELNAEFSPNV
jgi:predicted HTH domain antitoxin